MLQSIMSKQTQVTKPRINDQETKVKKDLNMINDSYASKIVKGEIVVTHSIDKSKASASEIYDRQMKEKKIAKAEKQKLELQRRLSFLDHSIKSIKDYDFSQGKNSPIKSSSGISPDNPRDALKRQSEMLHKIREQKKKLSEKKQKQRKKQQQKLQQSAEAKQQISEAEKAKKKQQILENMQKIKKRMELRQDAVKMQQEEYKNLVQRKTLFKKIQEEYSIKQSTILEERKKKLADIRNIHKPVRLSEIEDHQKHFLEVLKEKEFMRDRERRINNSVQQYKVSYKSPIHQQFTKKQEGENQSRVKTDKMRQFSQHVRQNFVPIIDERKKQSLEKLIDEENQKKRKLQQKNQDDIQRIQEIRSRGLRYLEQVRQLPKKRGTSPQNEQFKTDRVQYKNYLTHSQNSSSKNWSSILGGKYSKKDKAIKMQFQAQKLENSLRMKQQKARLLKKDADEIDQQYFDMIKAKLDLLQI